MKSSSPLWIIAKKEFFSYLNSAAAYLVLVPFLLISIFLFFRNAMIMNDANLRSFVELLPWFLMIIGPALAMKLFSEEKQKDTSELLFAHPVPEWMVVAGKFLGIVLFYGCMLLATVTLPITLLVFSRPDLGLMVGQYLGMLAVGSVFLAIGLAASALIGSAVGSFLAALAVNFILILLGMNFVVLMFPGFIGRIISEVAILPHVSSLSRGVLDLRDLLYFATLTLIALTLAVIKLSERKVAENRLEKQKLWLVMALVIGIGLAGNVFMYEFPLRLDLTTAKQYSVSSGTKELLAQLPDRVTISLYTSDNLPGSMQVTLRETSDWLKDFKRLSKRIALRTVNTDALPEYKQEALNRGMREVQFNQIGSNSFQVQTGFLGLEVRYGNKTEAIDFIENSSNLEYQLSRLILKLTQDNQSKIGYIAAGSNVAAAELNAMLAKQYALAPIDGSSSMDEALGVSGLLVIDDGTVANATPAAILRQHLANGGNAAVFIDGISLSTQTLSPQPSTSDILPILKDFGITIHSNLVYDLQLNAPVTLGQGSVRYIMPYPFWIRALMQSTPYAGTRSLNNVLLGWASSIETAPVNGWTITPILKTSPASSTQQEGSFTVDPNSIKTLTTTSGEQVVGIIATKDQQHLVVVSDADLVSDDFIQNSQENQVFVSNMVDLVAAHPILNQIPRRDANRNVFQFTSPTQAIVAQYANIIVPAVLSAAFGAWWLWRRRRLTRRKVGGKII